MLLWLKFPNPSLCAAPKTYGNNSPWHWFNYYYFSGQESLWQNRGEFFASRPRIFVFSIKPNFGRWTISTGLFCGLFFSADQSPPWCWMLIISHFKISWWKGYTGWEETVLQYEFIFPSHYPTEIKHFCRVVTCRVFFRKPNPRCSSVRTWGW